MKSRYQALQVKIDSGDINLSEVAEILVGLLHSVNKKHEDIMTKLTQIEARLAIVEENTYSPIYQGVEEEPDDYDGVGDEFVLEDEDEPPTESKK